MGAFLEDDALRNALLELCLHRPSQESVFISQTVLTLPRDLPWAPSSSTAAVGGGSMPKGVAEGTVPCIRYFSDLVQVPSYSNSNTPGLRHALAYNQGHD